jgi:hypothetical protein
MKVARTSVYGTNAGRTSGKTFKTLKNDRGKSPKGKLNEINTKVLPDCHDPYLGWQQGRADREVCADMVDPEMRA